MAPFPPASPGEPEADATPEAGAPDGFAVASHEALFAASDEPRCDACGMALEPADDDVGYAIPGGGVYLWTRGDAVCLEKAPLCAACASAIGITALARWEIEEEEG